MIIGLSGSSEGRREAVAVKLRYLRGMNNQMVSMPDGRNEPARTRRILQTIEKFPARSVNTNLIIAHVVTAAEAEAVRAAGGFMWHVQGKPSEVVPIMQHDLLVTDTERGDRHFLDPAEAISEQASRVAQGVKV